MAFFDNSVCWENNGKMVRAMDQVVEEKDPLNCVTLNVISVAQLERMCYTLCNKKHQIIVHEASRVLAVSCQHNSWQRGLGGVVGLMLPLALAAAVRVPYTTSPCSDLGQVVNLSLSVA